MQTPKPEAPKAEPKAEPKAPKSGAKAPEIKSLQDLEQFAPEAASYLKSLATSSAKEVEHHFNDLAGDEKKALANKQTEELLRKTYQFTDFALNLPPLVDMAADILIPLIPDAIDWCVDLLNKSGIFGKKEA